MTTDKEREAVERLLARSDWSPIPLGPCGVRASRRRRVAEEMVRDILKTLTTLQPIQEPDHPVDFSMYGKGEKP